MGSLADAERHRLLARVREFVEQVVAPVAADLDRRARPEDCFSWEIV